MIKIEIAETKNPGNPYACQIRRSQVEMFLEGFKELCNKTGMHKIDIGGKVTIIAISIPIISGLLETVIKVLP